MKVLIKLRSVSTSAGMAKNGDIVDLPDAEVKKIISLRPQALDILPELPLDEPKAEAPKAAPKKTPAKRSAKRVN